MEGKIYSAISKAMVEIGAVGKNQKNQQQGFMYRGIDAVMNAINPALINNGIFVVPEVLEQTREERTTSKGGLLIYSICKVKYTFFAEDGSSISAVVIGEGMDSGDKATNKAMSIAFKYACFQVFCIPTEEMIDPDAEVHEVKPQAPAKEEKKEEKKETKKDLYKETPEEKAENEKMMEEVGKEKISAVMLKALQKKLSDDKIPEELLLKLYKVEGLKDFTNKQYRNCMDNWEKLKARATA
jgi:hypothetical protein